MSKKIEKTTELNINKARNIRKTNKTQKKDQEQEQEQER